jgi:hypothetical protein
MDGHSMVEHLLHGAVGLSICAGAVVGYTALRHH